MITMIWILIVITTSSGVAESSNIIFQEFNTKFECHAASIEIMKMAGDMRHIREVKTSCVKKGQDIQYD